MPDRAKTGSTGEAAVGSRLQTAARAIDDTDRNLAQWLREVALGKPVVRQAPQPAPDEPAAEVLEYFERRIGRKLRSRAAVDGYLTSLEARESELHARGMRRGIIRGAVLLALILAAFLQYYYWDVKLEIASLPGVQVFVPVSPASRTAPAEAGGRTDLR